MKILRCENCGADVEIQDDFLSAVCPYCGSKALLSPEDLGINKTTSELLAEMFRGEAVGSFLKQQIKKRNRDELWKTHSCTELFEYGTENIEIRYIYKTVSDSVAIFTARSNVALLFKDDNAAERYCRTVRALRFPENDTKNLSQYIPNIINKFVLNNRQILVVIEKGDNEYPLEVFKKLPDVHAAWVISRLENLCCLFQFNGIAVPKFNISDLYIDPDEHQIFFYGGFQNAVQINSSSHDADTEAELIMLRKIAAAVMGYNSIEDAEDNIPEEFYEFLKEIPKEGAYEDFEQWDLALTLSYGKRVFRNLDYTEGSIY